MNNYSLNNFVATFPSVKIHKGTVIYSCNELIDCLYYLQQGQVRNYCCLNTAQEFTFKILSGPILFPLRGLFYEMNNIGRFEAFTDIIVCKIPKNIILTFLLENPSQMGELLKDQLDYVNDILQLLKTTFYSSARTRILLALIQIAKGLNCIDFESHNSTTINLKLTHELLGTYTGLSRETVTRVLLKLTKENVLSINAKHITIKDIAASIQALSHT